MSEMTQQEATPDTGEVLVHLSALAADKVREYMSEEGMTEGLLRVSVLPGGCSGFEYGLELDDVVREDDYVFLSKGVRVVVDPFSAQYLAGVSVDFTSSFQGTGFKFENPNATGSCGCGTSFAV
jgi:iron-sulfur cluster assembly protein